MRKKRSWLVILVMVLLFGMTVPGCVKAQTNNHLNGTWMYEEGTIDKYNSGKYESTEEDGTPICQGSYTTGNGKITYTLTHYFGTYINLDPRWYSKNELKDHPISEYLEPFTYEYIVDDNKLTYIYAGGETATLTLLSRDVKFNQAADSSKKSIPVSSGSMSSFPGRWSLEEGPRRNNPEEMDLLKDGTGIVDGAGVSWKIENGRFYLIHPFIAFSSIYNVSGSTLTLTKDDGVILKYKKK